MRRLANVAGAFLLGVRPPARCNPEWRDVRRLPATPLDRMIDEMIDEAERIVACAGWQRQLRPYDQDAD